MRLGPASDPNLNAAATAICTQHKRPPTYIMEPQGWGWGSARSVRNLAGGPPKKDAARDRRSRAGGGPGGDSNPRPRGLQSVLSSIRPRGPKYSGHTKVTAKKKRHAKARRKSNPPKNPHFCPHRVWGTLLGPAGRSPLLVFLVPCGCTRPQKTEPAPKHHPRRRTANKFGHAHFEARDHFLIQIAPNFLSKVRSLFCRKYVHFFCQKRVHFFFKSAFTFFAKARSRKTGHRRPSIMGFQIKTHPNFRKKT